MNIRSEPVPTRAPAWSVVVPAAGALALRWALIATSRGDAVGVVSRPSGPGPHGPSVVGLRASRLGGCGEDGARAGQFGNAGPSRSYSCHVAAKHSPTAESDAIRPAGRLGHVDLLPVVGRRPTSADEGKPGAQCAFSSSTAARADGRTDESAHGSSECRQRRLPGSPPLGWRPHVALRPCTDCGFAPRVSSPGVEADTPLAARLGNSFFTIQSREGHNYR